MANQALLDLILQKRARGASDDDIRRAAAVKGWSELDITGAFAALKLSEIPQTGARTEGELWTRRKGTRNNILAGILFVLILGGGMYIVVSQKDLLSNLFVPSNARVSSATNTAQTRGNSIPYAYTGYAPFYPTPNAPLTSAKSSTGMLVQQTVTTSAIQDAPVTTNTASAAPTPDPFPLAPVIWPTPVPDPTPVAPAPTVPPPTPNLWKEVGTSLTAYDCGGGRQWTLQSAHQTWSFATAASLPLGVLNLDRFILKPGDVWSGDLANDIAKERTECSDSRTNRIAYDQEYWLSFNVLYHSTVWPPDAVTILGQVHEGCSSGYPVFAFNIEKSGLQLRYSTAPACGGTSVITKAWSDPSVEENRWYHYVVEFRINSHNDTTGLIKLWRDGSLVYDGEGINLSYGDDPSLSYWKMGAYRYASSRTDCILYSDVEGPTTGDLSGRVASPLPTPDSLYLASCP